jgi:hypothetical protein
MLHERRGGRKGQVGEAICVREEVNVENQEIQQEKAREELH